ncbi:MAG: DEAD/DEAH box helicase [Xanthomonadaceae bacterium]|nr:DEAD/DEAH box helicase [Xanthomonadaceae bacterium]
MENFSELNLLPQIQKAITEMGYEKPTGIQIQALPILMGEPTDFIGLAATGTGKTAAFSIPMLQKIDPSKHYVQTLILSPTRELAIQIAGQIDLLGKHLGIRALPIYGGAGYDEQLRGLKKGPAVVVGTPGRVIDHMERGTLKLDRMTLLILDEADEMISMGFKEELDMILSSVPKEQSNIWLFSATMGREVDRVTKEYLTHPKQVQINKTEMLPDTIEQIYYMTMESNKPDILCKIVEMAEDFYGIVFCQTKMLTMDLTRFMTDRGYKVDCLHGDLSQSARERTMQSFRDKKIKVLICTDVASRGLDVKDVTHVINFSIPRELENYVHRIGRTARSGKKGYAMSLVTNSHRVLIGRLEQMTKSKIKEGKIPTRKEIGMKKVSNLLQRFKDQKDFARAMEVIGDDWKAAISEIEMTREEIVARFLSFSFPEIFAAHDELVHKKVMPRSVSESAPPRRDGRGGGGGYSRDRGPRRDGDYGRSNTSGAFGGGGRVMRSGDRSENRGWGGGGRSDRPVSANERGFAMRTGNRPKSSKGVSRPYSGPQKT